MDDFDLTRPSLDYFTSAGHAFEIPSTPQPVSLLTGFHPDRVRLNTGPWLNQSPFDLSTPKAFVILSETETGHASFRDGSSTGEGTSNEHLSVAGGITVGYPFLNAGVHMKYDKTIVENTSSYRASRNASCRIGRIILDQAPPFSEAAKTILQSKGGIETFREQYGDYFISGYVLGADVGVSLSTSTVSTTQKESLEAYVKAKALFFEVKSPPIRINSQKAAASASFTFSGYATYDQDTQSIVYTKLPYGEEVDLRNKLSSYFDRVNNIEVNLWERLRYTGVYNKQSIDLSTCLKLCQSGLVVRLVLTPFARLNEFLRVVAEIADMN